MKIITVASLKGGVGKTTLCAFLAQTYADAQRKVLVVDLDHNNNLTDYFLRKVDPRSIEQANAYHALTGSLSPDQCIHANGRLSVLPCTLSLTKVSPELARDPATLLRFAAALKKLPFELILIDTPPALSPELTAGLFAASLVLVPLSFSRWTAQGLSILSAELNNVQRATGRKAILRGVPVCVTVQQAAKLRASAVCDLTHTAITKSATIRTACEKALPLKAKSQSYTKFKELAEELV